MELSSLRQGPREMLSYPELKASLAGTWNGEGLDQSPELGAAAYEETWIFVGDTDLPVLHFSQKSRCKGNHHKIGQTIFWDTGFLIWSIDGIRMVSAQANGQLDLYNSGVALRQNGRTEIQWISQQLPENSGGHRWERSIQVAGEKMSYQQKLPPPALAGDQLPSLRNATLYRRG